MKSLAAIMLVALVLAACSPEPEVPPTPEAPSTAGPSWKPQEAIAAIETPPLAMGELPWNAEYDRYLGRWQVTLIDNFRKMYPPRDERQTLLWHVYGDTWEVEGPFQ